MTSQDAYFYLLSKNILPTEEKIIVSYDAYYAYCYAKDRLNNTRFKLGETTLSQHPLFALKYAQYILKSRFILGETEINKKYFIFQERYMKLIMGYNHE